MVRSLGRQFYASAAAKRSPSPTSAVVFPVVTGSTGRERIYDGYPDVAPEMVASRTFDDRLQLLEHVPTVVTGPPGSGQTDSTTTS